MTQTMDNAAATLREIAAKVLTDANKSTLLVLDERDIETAANMVAEDRKLLHITALGGMGTRLYDALTVWFEDYVKTRTAWLTRTKPGRAVLKQRAPQHFEMMVQAELAAKPRRNQRKSHVRPLDHH